MAMRDDRLTTTKLLLRVRHHESSGGARRHQVGEVAGRLGVCKVILDVRAGLDDQDFQFGIGIGETSCNNASSGSTC